MAAYLKKIHRLLQGRQPHFSLLQSRSLFNWYDKKEGVPRDFLVWMQQDYDFSLKGMKRSYAEFQMLMLKDSQQYRPERHKALGPDLATSHFIVKRGGSVKFVGRDMWFKMDENGKYYVPNRKVEGMTVEAVDASNTNLMYDGLDNLVDLKCLRYLNIGNCQYVDDWCLSRLQRYKDSLEFLDISGCGLVTDDGLASLHHLVNLKALKVSNLPKVKHKELMTLLIEETIPGCQVFGVDFAVEEPRLYHGDTSEDSCPNSNVGDGSIEHLKQNRDIYANSSIKR